MKMEPMKCGTEEFEVHLPADLIAAELEPNQVELPQRTPAEHIRWALDHPVDSAPLKELVKAGDKVCIIISDVTRRWQSPETYIPVLIAELESAGVRDEDMLIISATGTHRRQTPEEHMGLVTKEVYDRIELVDHVCTDEENLAYVGTTTRGTPVWLDKRALACDKIILTGGVVYHFMAGFGGGRKSILPGIAGRETIMKNHNLALNPGLGNGSNPQVRSANMNANNPVHADMMEACSMANPTFLVNVVVNDDQQVIAAFAGNWITAHRAACDLVDRMYGVPAKEKTPLVIASAGGFPKDLNFYQTIKTLSNALEVVEDGGTIFGNPVPGGLRKRRYPAPDCGVCHHGGAGKRSAGEFFHWRLHRLPLCGECRKVPYDRGHGNGAGGLRPLQDPRGQNPGSGSGAVP